MRMSSFVALGAAFLAAAPAAAADDGFTGARLEGRLGWDNLQTRADIPDPIRPAQRVSAEPLDSALSYGVEGGYDHPLGASALVGAYAGIEQTGARVCREISADDWGCGRVKRTVSAGVRTGWIIGPGAMLYAKGGWSMGSTQLGYTDFGAAKADKEYQPYARKKTRSGFHLGAGLEVPFGFDLYGKIEYAYTDYGRDSFIVPAGTSATSDDVSASVHMRRHQAVAGFGIRF